MKKIIYYIFSCLVFISCHTTHDARLNNINPASNDNYAHLTDKVDARYRFISGNELRIVYRENYESTSLQYKIYEKIPNNILQDNTQVPVTIKHGINYITIPLSSSFSSLRYILEVTDAKNQKQYLHVYLKR